MPELDDPKAADPARDRLRPKGHWLRLRSSRSGNLTPKDDSDIRVPETSSSSSRPPVRTLASAEMTPALTDIALDDSFLPDDDSKDNYRWAIVYENQRGITIFSSPYFSSASLLPIDPAPFTLPTSRPMSRTDQPPLTLRTYPLPSGAWRWVSSQWMIDMRSDGTTGYDGFEYNWVFKRHGWTAQASTAGWVRRRRWVRLMIRPGLERRKELLQETADDEEELDTEHSDRGNNDSEKDPKTKMHTVWRGGSDGDWKRCRTAMRDASTDGRRLELWQAWLGVPAIDKSKVKQWTEDDEPMPSEKEILRMQEKSVAEPAADPQYVVAVLRACVRYTDWTVVYQQTNASRRAQSF